MRQCRRCGVSFQIPKKWQQKIYCSRRCGMLNAHEQAVKNVDRRSLADRFWERVNQGDGCWEWNSTRIPRGYGYFHWGSKARYAHRTAWELTYGKIPNGMFVCHHCDNPPCVRPDHLFLGTQSDNMRDCKEKGRGKYPRAEQNGLARLTFAEAEEVRREVHEGIPQAQIARRLQVHPSCVWNIVHGRTYRRPA